MRETESLILELGVVFRGMFVLEGFINVLIYDGLVKWGGTILRDVVPRWI